jgi:HD-GYP domain-containing protein (c-di-GMP phosphodiesterase class II)
MIHRFAEIVAVADCYDSYISGRPREGIEPCDVKTALRKLIEMGGNLLNADIVKTLTTIVPLYR